MLSVAERQVFWLHCVDHLSRLARTTEHSSFDEGAAANFLAQRPRCLPAPDLDLQRPLQ